MADFPVANQQDQSKFATQYEEKTISSEVEGGAALSRPRTSRRARKTFKTGWTWISNADKALIDAFIETHGMFLSFNYTDPTTGTVHVVRLQAIPEFKQVGKGAVYRWNSDDVVMKEV